METWDAQRQGYNSHRAHHRCPHQHPHHSRKQSFSSSLLDAICKSTEDVQETIAYKKSSNRQETRNAEAEDKTLIRNSSYRNFSTLERLWDEDHPARILNNEKLLRGRSANLGVFNVEKYKADAAYNKRRSGFHLSFQSSSAPCADYTSDSTNNCPYLSSDSESFYRRTSSISTAKAEKNSHFVGHEERAYKWGAVGGECSRDLHEKSSVRDGKFRSTEKHIIPADHRAKIKSEFKTRTDSRKPKHPISPGSKLSNFLNSLFIAGNRKKPKLPSCSSVHDYNSHHPSERKPTSTYSSSSSVQSRPCLSKTSRGSKNINGVKRCVTFYPTSVIVDEASRPCGEKYLQGMEKPTPNRNPYNYQQITHPSKDANKLTLLSEKMKHLKVGEDSHAVAVSAKNNIIAKHQKTNSIMETAVIWDLDIQDEEEEEDDDRSWSSSDLFELGSLEAIDMNVYGKELHV